MDSVQPLRISKPISSPAIKGSTSIPMAKSSLPLSEIGMNSPRRNSPSQNLATKRISTNQDGTLHSDNGSATRATKSTLREFWSSKEAVAPSRFDENTPERTPSPAASASKRRPSVERLMQASRVKNSNMFALESKDVYDPTSTPIVERPSANRPLSEQITNNSFARLDFLKKENHLAKNLIHTSDQDNTPDSLSPVKSPSRVPLPSSPDKQSSPSPTKSSLARVSQFGISQKDFYDPAKPVLGLEERISKPRTLRRHAKSVTFHEDPPEVNEYEQQTPEPSLSVASDREGSWDSDEYYDQDYSLDQGSAADNHNDDSFDADLENTDKTPVVLPEDWSRMSPSEARTDLVDGDDDVFDGVDEETARIHLPHSNPRSASDGEARPLPPIPGMRSPVSGSDSSLVRSPSTLLKQASCSKADILDITRASSLSAHERLSLLASPNHTPQPSIDLGTTSEVIPMANLDLSEKTDVKFAQLSEIPTTEDLPDFTAAPRISRESILRKVRNTKYDFDDEEDDDDEYDEENYNDHRGGDRPTIAEMARMDPDDPVPSREGSHNEGHASLHQNHDDQVDEYSMASIKLEPNEIETYDESVIHNISQSQLDDYDRQGSVLHHQVQSESEDDYSVYSESILPDGESTPTRLCSEKAFEDAEKETLDDAMQLLTIHDYAATSARPATGESSDKVDLSSGSVSQHLPEGFDKENFGTGFADFMKPLTTSANIFDSRPDFSVEPQNDIVSLHESVGDSDEVLPSSRSPAQTLPISSASFDGDETSEISALHDSELQQPELQEIPERKATIKTNGRLKARPSGSAADFVISAEQRRCDEEQYPVPPIPQGFTAEIEGSGSDASYASIESTNTKADSLVDNDDSFMKRDNTTLLSLDIPTLASDDEDGLGLDAEFDKVIESQKKGYVTRENAKVVVASNRNVSGDSQDTAKTKATTPARHDSQASSLRQSNSTNSRKASGEQYLKTEPWNGTTRRKSIRNASSLANSHAVPTPAPGLKPLGVVDEGYAAGYSNLDADVGEDVERGRLFVKVVGARDLDLPLPRNDRLCFQLTLDNGLHCVTTSDLELSRSANVGQEFELVVLNDLEFQLTLTTKLPPPPAAPAVTAASPPKQMRNQKTAFSRFLSSPKKRAEKERQEREAAEAEERRLQEEARRKRATLKPTAWDLLHDVVNEADGSFARAYVNLETHEKHCFGRPLTVRVPCYNEWALEKDIAVMASVRSKRGTHAGPVRRPPYIIGHLELQLLYIPKPKGASDDNLPKSMNGAIREMNKAEETKKTNHEGFLSQQGGDCIHWRRRFFRLQGSHLTAYHEHTNQKRAVINLAKASRLVDDRSTLVADPTSSNPKNKNRRKSAFAEEDEGYQYVEEGFRLRFANGETIDFYADNRAMKEEWMKSLSQVIGKQDNSKKTTMWTDLVLAREQAEIKADKHSSLPQPSLSGAGRPNADVCEVINQSVSAASTTKSSRKQGDRRPVPTASSGSDEQQAQAPAPPARARTPPMNARTDHRSRTAVKSMIF